MTGRRDLTYAHLMWWIILPLCGSCWGCVLDRETVLAGMGTSSIIVIGGAAVGFIAGLALTIAFHIKFRRTEPEKWRKTALIQTIVMLGSMFASGMAAVIALK